MCRLLFDGSPDAIFLADADTGVILDANPAAEKLIGRPLADIIGLPQSALHPAGQEALSHKLFSQHVVCASAGGYTMPEEHSVLRADGSLVPVEITAKIIKVKGRKVLQGFFRDISFRTRAEKDLRESEEKFRLLAEKSLIGVYLIQDGKFRYTNPVHARIFGYTQEELVGGMGPRDLVLPEDWPLVEEQIRKRVSGELGEVRYDFRGRRKDGGDVSARRGHALAARQFRCQAHAKGKLLDARLTQVELQRAARFLTEADEPRQRDRGPHRRIARDRAGHEKRPSRVPALQELAAGARHAHGHVLHIGRSHRITSKGSSPCGQTAGRRRGRRR